MAERRNITVRKYRVGEELRVDEETQKLTPGERISLAWEITKSVWSLKEPGWHESRLRRDVARVVRRGEESESIAKVKT